MQGALRPRRTRTPAHAPAPAAETDFSLVYVQPEVPTLAAEDRAYWLAFQGTLPRWLIFGLAALGNGGSHGRDSPEHEPDAGSGAEQDLRQAQASLFP